MSEKMREEFESWLSDNGQLALKEDDGEYSFQHTRLAWQAWQSSRAALAVELPRCWSDEARDYRDDLVGALDECGISHK